MDSPVLPGEVDDHVGFFDRFATRATGLVSRAPFFVACIMLVAIWVPSYFVLQDLDTWQLIINTATTIVTFLLVALLQNSSHRDNLAIQHKLNGIANALADFMCATDEDLSDDVEDLQAAVGLEDKESS